MHPEALMREQWQRSDYKPKSRPRDRGKYGPLRGNRDGWDSGGAGRRSDRKRQLEELTELEMEEMLDMVDEGDKTPE